VKADLTRSTFDPLKRFTRVLMQQGRVQLDADWNEQTDILLHLLRSLLADAFPAGGGNGFALAKLATKNPVADDFVITPGTFYVGGILCELGGTPVPVVKWDGKTITVAAWTADGVAFQRDQYVELSDRTTDPPKTLATAKITALDYTKLALTLDTDATPPNDLKNVVARRLVTYKSQPDLPGAAALAKSTSYQVYLDVWEQVVTFVQDDSMREVALNGPDTAARTRVVWQIKATPYTPPQATAGTAGNAAITGTQDRAALDVANAQAAAPQAAAGQIAAAQGASGVANTGQTVEANPLPIRKTVCMTPQGLANLFQPANAGLLRARTQPSQVSSDPCTIAPDSAYRGPENQLYRVEVHTGGALGKASFKWSRENGSVVFPIDKLAPGSGTTSVTLENLGRDDRYGLVEGDYVEIQDDGSVLTNAAGVLLQVQSIDRASGMLTLKGDASTTVGTDPALHPLLRRWDHKAGDPAAGGSKVGEDGALPIVTKDWLDLEDGVQVQFPEVPGATYRTGDYWLIPARVATGDVIWPLESGPDAQGNVIVNPLAKPPDGIVHYYAPIAVVAISDNAAPEISSCGQPGFGRTG
jgi:Family of unknown function (DUF6519)